MLRSIARSRQAVRSFRSSQNSKVQSYRTSTACQSQSPSRVNNTPFRYQNPRFHSQLSAKLTEENSVAHETELGLGQNIDASSSIPLDTENDLSEQFTSGVSEDGNNAQMENYGFEEVYEIDMEKVKSVVSLLESKIEGSLSTNLDEMELDLHEEFVLKVIETTPNISSENSIGFFQWAVKKAEVKVTTRLVEALFLTTCSNLTKKDVYALWDLVKEIGEKDNGVINVGILDELVAQLSKLGKPKAVLEVFNKYGDFECNPTVGTYYHTIEALSKRSYSDWACSVCEKMLETGLLPNNEQVGKIISSFCKLDKPKEALLLYKLAKEQNKLPPQSYLNTLVRSLCLKDDTVMSALEVLSDFPKEARKSAIKPFSSVVNGLCRMKSVNEAKTLLLEMVSEGPPPGNALFNTIINGYSKAGDLNEANELVKLMESRGLKPDVYTYTVIMSGYANGGQMEEAVKVLSEAKKKHAKLTPVTYHTLIRGYCKLEEYDNALKLLSEMKEFGVNPSADEYNKLIQTLCVKALDWEKAEKLQEEMKEQGLHLNGITRGLIQAVKELDQEVAENVELIAEA